MPEEKIKIAFPTKNSRGLEDVVSEAFGRAEYFTIVNLVEGSIGVETLKNPASSFKHGAGPVAVKTLVDMGVKIVGAGELGVGALELLEQSGVKYFRVKPGITVKNAVKTVLAEMEERLGVG